MCELLEAAYGRVASPMLKRRASNTVAKKRKGLFDILVTRPQNGLMNENSAKETGKMRLRDSRERSGSETADGGLKVEVDVHDCPDVPSATPPTEIRSSARL